MKKQIKFIKKIYKFHRKNTQEDQLSHQILEILKIMFFKSKKFKRGA